MGTDTISTPSFQSDWYKAIAKNKALANITIPHDLDQYPVKVDVQVKVQINGVDHYFTGSGSANRDDDLYYDFGGVVYLYNDKEIVLSTPFFNSRPGFEGGIAFTGNRFKIKTALFAFFFLEYTSFCFLLDSDDGQLVAPCQNDITVQKYSFVSMRSCLQSERYISGVVICGYIISDHWCIFDIRRTLCMVVCKIVNCRPLFMPCSYMAFNVLVFTKCLSGGRIRSTRREPSTIGKQQVNFITCGCESIAPFL